MKRALDYARYSTDLQSDKSVEDQHHDNGRHIKERGYFHVGSRSDRGISGAFILNRPGMLQVIEDAKNGLFDVLIAEHPDRLSRSQADMSMLYQVMRFHNVEIECLSGGVLTSLSAGLYGLMGQEQREAIGPKVRRGHAGVLRDGRIPAGMPYGYETTPGQPGVHRINPEHAPIVRLIYQLYVAGLSPRAIAAHLSELGVPPPRNAPAWRPSTLHGNPKRGTGILCNRHYLGHVIYGKHTYPKNPDTGRKVQRLAPQANIREAFIESLRIIDDELFEKAQEIRKQRALHGPKNSRGRGKKRILSGLLSCSSCGGGVSICGRDSSGDRIQCSTARDTRSCDNRSRYYLRVVESFVVEAVQLAIEDADVVGEYILNYKEEVERICGASRRDLKQIEKELRVCEQQRSVLVQKIAKELITDEEAAPLVKDLRQRVSVLQQQRHAAEHVHTSAELNERGISRYRENLQELKSVLLDGAQSIDPSVMSAFRELVAGVIVYPRARGEPYTIRIAGHLNAIVKTEARPPAMSGLRHR